ncbi:MAG: cellulase family glycosylhydrolase, partial [Oscillospiraceae bacterium]
MKKFLSLLLATAVCVNLFAIVSFQGVNAATTGPIIEGPVDWINEPLKGYQIKSPMENTFKIEGSDKKFTLLDVGNNADSKWLVFTQDYYGTRRFDKTGNKIKHKFDVSDPNNIAYWLNNDFLTNGNICCGGPLKLPDKIIENINMKHVWRTEVGHPGSICDADKVGGKYFENTCGVAMMAFGEFVYYNGKYGVMDEAKCTCQADSRDTGWWLRSPNGPSAVLSSMYGEQKGTVKGWGADGNLNVRPLFYLKESFVKNVKIDARMLGKNVKKAILASCTIDDLKRIGYSDVDIEIISDVENDSTEQIDIMKGDNTIGISANPSFDVSVLTNVSAAQEYRVEWNVPSVISGSTKFTPTKGVKFNRTIEVPLNTEGTYNVEVKLYIANALAKTATIPISYIERYKPEFMDEYREKGVATHFAMANSPDTKNIELLKSGGIKMVRDEIFWSTLEKQKGIYDFAYSDSYLNPLAEAGIEFIVALDYNNALYYSGTPTTTEAITGYCNYAKAVAARYPSIKVFEIWNEPNLEHFWGGTPNASDYAKLVRAASEAIKSVRPDAKVYGGVTSDADINYMRTFLAGDVYDFIDGISIHPYCYPHPADQGKIEGRINGNRKLIEQYGGFKDVIITEFGWSSYTGDIGTTEEGQARDIVKEFAISDDYNIAYNSVYDFKDDGSNPDDAEHNYGMIQEYYNPKPSYYSVKTFNQVIGGAEYYGKLSLADGVRGYVYNKNGEPIIMAWSVSQGDTPGATKNVDLGTNVTALDMYGKLVGGGTSLDIGANPVYIKGMPKEVLIKAASLNAVTDYKRIISDWGATLDTTTAGRSIKHKIEMRVEILNNIANGSTNCDYQVALSLLNENYSDGDTLIFDVHSGQLKMEISTLTVLLDALNQAGNSIAKLNVATMPTDIMAPNKLNSPKTINRAKAKISEVPTIQAQYAKSVLRQSENLADVASGVLMSEATSSLKTGIILTKDLMAEKLAVWSENLVNSGNSPYVNIMVEDGVFSLTGA